MVKEGNYMDNGSKTVSLTEFGKKVLNRRERMGLY